MNICKIFLLGSCQAPTVFNGRISNFPTTEILPDGSYYVGSRLGLICDVGYRRYARFFYSDCIEPGIWAAPLTECIPNDEGNQK